MNKLVNGILTELTPEEEAEWLAAQVGSLDDVKSAKMADLAALRYQKEAAGIILSGGAWSFSQLNPAVRVNWKSAYGWIQMDATDIAAIAGAVATHVQACFSNERVHAEAIAALETSEAVAAYDLTTGWPD